MIIKLIKFFNGYLLVQIKGYSPERFINLCSSRGILLWNLKKSTDGYEFNISLKAFRKLKPIVRKTKTTFRIMGKNGLPFFLYKYRKRKFFFFGVFIFAVLIYLLSLFIWDITIQGEYTNTNDMILKFLRENNVYTGIMKNKINCKDIEYKIRNHYEDIGWVSAQIKGTRLIIDVNEVVLKDIKTADTTPAHLKANKDGIITSIITREGTPKVSIGDVVKKEDILISGIIDVIGDNDILIRKTPVLADGDILAKTFYEYKETYPLTYIVKEYTGNQKKKYLISLINKKITVYNPRISYNKYDIIEINNQLKFSESFYLPVIFSISTIREYKENTLLYNKNEIEDIAREKLYKFLENLTKRGIQIISNDVTIGVDKKSCTAVGKIHVIENIAALQSIEEVEWRQEPDEHSGDNN